MCNLTRKRMALDAIDGLSAQSFFELGVGRGDVLLALGERGLRGYGIDFSAESIAICRQKIAAQHLEDRLRVDVGDLFALDDDAHYDLAIAFEVLEHIEDDRAALGRIRRLLRPGGYFLISVPARMRKWGAIDVWAGHVRRYERDELQEKLATGGFDIVSFRSYGYPLLTLTNAARNLIYARATDRGDTARQRTMGSGTALPLPLRLLQPTVPVYAWLVHQTQRPFLRSNLGDHYFVVARRLD